MLSSEVWEIVTQGAGVAYAREQVNSQIYNWLWAGEVSSINVVSSSIPPGPSPCPHTPWFSSITGAFLLPGLRPGAEDMMVEGVAMSLPS